MFQTNVLSKVQRVLCDGSTDSAIVEKEVVYVLFANPDNFAPSLTFMLLVSLESQDAKGVKKAIQKPS